jgi:hypothetical protein
MSVVLYEGVVTTPRNLDHGGRRSVPGDCRGVFSRTAVPKQRADLDTNQVLTGLALSARLGINRNGWLRRRPNNPIAPREFPSGVQIAT